MRLDSGKSRKHANGNHPKDARFPEFTTVSGGDSNERRAGGRKRGAVDTQEAGSVASDGCGGAAAELRGGDDLVHRKLTWRYFMLFGLVTQAVTEASVLHTFQFGALVARVCAKAAKYSIVALPRPPTAGVAGCATVNMQIAAVLMRGLELGEDFGHNIPRAVPDCLLACTRLHRRSPPLLPSQKMGGVLLSGSRTSRVFVTTSGAKPFAAPRVWCWR